MKIIILPLLILSSIFSMNSHTNHTPQVIAHRGGANLAPENTLAAFRNAIRLGADMIEIDVEQTADSVVMVLHDTKVDRTTDGEGHLEKLTYDYVKKLDAGSWFSEKYQDERLPTLDETLELIDGKVILLIEIKDGSERYPGIERRTVELIHEYKAKPWVIVQSFNKKAIDRVKALDPEIRTYYLMGGRFREFYKEAIAKGSAFKFDHEGVAVHKRELDKEDIVGLKKMGIKTFVWTVDDPADMQNFIDWGVDGIITDAPDELLKLVR